MSKGPKQKSQDLAASQGLREVKTDEAINSIARDILITMHRQASDKMKAKIEQVYSEWNGGAKFYDDEDQITSMLLVGPPGHGKTTSFKEAGKKVARALGMQFVENAAIDTIDEVDPEKHFIFVTQETAGVVSALEWLGLPTKEHLSDKDKTAVMGRLYSARLRKAEKAAGSIILLDDFLNASPSIQNVGLSLSEEKRYADLNLTRSYVGLTGNMGALDGTHTSRPSTALRSRCRVLFIQDNYPNFEARAQSRWRDDIGDAAVLGFLRRHEDCFTEMPDPTQMGGFPTPRSWDKFIVQARRAVRAAGGNLAAAMPELDMESAATLGLQVNQKYTGYMNAYIKSADPLAREIVLEGRTDRKFIDEKISAAMSPKGPREGKEGEKAGFSQDAQWFKYQLALALSDYAAIKVVKDGGDLKEAVQRMAVGMIAMEDQTNFGLCLENFKRTLAMRMESLSSKLSDTRRELKQDIKQEVANIIVGTPGATAKHREDAIAILSDMSMYEDARARRRRRAPG